MAITYALLGEAPTGSAAGASSGQALGRGEIHRHPFSFAAPEVGRRTAYRIELDVQEEQRAQDVFEMEVFPRSAGPDLDGRSVALVDARGDAAAGPDPSRPWRRAGSAAGAIDDILTCRPGVP